MQSTSNKGRRLGGLYRRARVRLEARCLLLVCLFNALPVGGADAEAQALEYNIKSGYLYNFAKFVEWPENAVPFTNSPIVIGVLAEDPAAPFLEQQLRGKLANSHPLTIKLLSEVAGLTSCQMFFISRAQTHLPEDLLASAQKASVLVVGEVDQFAHRGGMINFIRRDETFRLEVNLESAEKAGLKVSAKLASIATIVKTRK